MEQQETCRVYAGSLRASFLETTEVSHASRVVPLCFRQRRHSLRRPGPGAATLDLAHRHDPGRHPGDRRRARPGHRGHPLHGLHDVRPAGDVGSHLGDRARQAGAGPRHQVVPGPGRPDEMDLRAAPGREVPSRRAVHGRRRDLQPRPHPQRQVAGLRPAGPQRADRRGLAAGRLSQDRRLQGRAADQGRRHGDALAAQPLHHRQRRQFREGRQGLAGLPQVAVGHRSVEDEGVDAARAGRARAQHRILEQGPHPQDRAHGAAADARRRRRARRRCCRAGSTGSNRRRPIRSTSSGRAAARSKPTPSRICGPIRSACCPGAPTADIRVRKALNLADRPRRHGEAAERARGAGRRLRAARPSVVRHAQLQDQVRSGRGQEADGRGGLWARQEAQDEDRDLDLGLGPDVSADHERVHPAAIRRDRRRSRIPGDGLERAPEHDAPGRQVGRKERPTAPST